MLQPETILQNRYRIVRKLGVGGFGDTYEVEDLVNPDHDLKVLKVLRTDYAKAIELFQREAKVLSQLNHPGIPKIQEHGYFTCQISNHPDLWHCLIMEKIPGCNLKQWLTQQKKPLTEYQAKIWMIQLLAILIEIHQKQLFHRDIKPSNIMLKPNGQLALIDFGAVREVTNTIVSGQASTCIGTRGYGAPEQLLSDKPSATPQSDFFALGRTFVHLLTGQSPAHLESDASTYQLNWRQAAPGVSPEFANFLDRLMAHFPSQRPKTAAEALRILVNPLEANAEESAEQQLPVNSLQTTQIIPPLMPPLETKPEVQSRNPVQLGFRKILEIATIVLKPWLRP
jgi:serine/threonine protein kinase